MGIGITLTAVPFILPILTIYYTITVPPQRDTSVCALVLTVCTCCEGQVKILRLIVWYYCGYLSQIHHTHYSFFYHPHPHNLYHYIIAGVHLIGNFFITICTCCEDYPNLRHAFTNVVKVPRFCMWFCSRQDSIFWHYDLRHIYHYINTKLNFVFNNVTNVWLV